MSVKKTKAEIKKAKNKAIKMIRDGGYTVQEIAEAIGYADKSQIYYWERTDEDFREKLAEAREDFYKNRLEMAERGQAMLLEGYEYEEVSKEYENGKLKSEKKTKKFHMPNSSVVIHTLKNLDPAKYNNPDRIDHTTGGEKMPGPSTVNLVVKNPKSLQQDGDDD